jgi:uroporphyrinogen decarboxylase
MNSRERVKTALNHKEPDKVPFDLGGTVLTSVHVSTYQRLRDLLGLPEREIGVMDIFQQIATVDDDVREALGCDVRNVAPRSSATFNIEINTTDLPGYDFFHDEWGIGWRKPKEGGFFYDMFDHPLSETTTVADIQNYPWPNPTDPARFTNLAERARSVAEELKEGVILGGMAAGYFELTCWTRGYAKVYPDMVTNIDWLTNLMDQIIDIKLAYWDIALPLVGEYADVVQEADDLAGQFGLLMSPDFYRQYIKPRHKRIFDFIKARSNAKIFYHCCGAIREILPDLIEVGVDIINPVQVSAAGMESKALKRDFGSEITFWGGLVDTQGIFTDGTPQQVRDEVRRRIDDFAPGGGFIAAAVHNIQANVPAENILAMWEALQEYGVYAPDNAPGHRPDSYWEDYPEAPAKPPVFNTSPDAIAGRALTPEEVGMIFNEEHGEQSAVLNELRDAIINGNPPIALEKTRKALDQGVEPSTIINDVIVPAMTIVGQKFECGEYFLPEMMASALGTQGAMKVLRPLLAASGIEPLATVVVGTVKGDLHDIGKNIVAMMWEGSGFNVVDLGPDVSAERFVEAVREHNADMVGMSALLTTTMPMMGKIIKAIEEAGLRDKVKIMVGGAGVTQAFVNEIGADGYAPDASAAVRKARELLALPEL